MIIKIMNCNLKSIAFKNGTLMMSINISRKSFHTTFINYKIKDSKDSLLLNNDIQNVILNYIHEDVNNPKLQQYKIEKYLNINCSIFKEYKENKNSFFEQYPKLIHNELNSIVKILSIIKEQHKNSKDKIIPLYEVNDIEIASIILKKFLDIINSIGDVNKNNLVMELGNYVYNSHLLKEYKDYKKIDKDISFKEFKIEKAIDVKKFSILGDLLLTVGKLATNLIEYDTTKSIKKQEIIIKPSEKGKEYIKEIKGDLLGFKLPMVCEPNNWNKKNEKGGYLLNSSNYLDELIHESSSNVLRSEAEDNIILMINRVQRTPFKINENVLNYVLENGQRLKLILDELQVKKVVDKKSIEYKKYISHNSRYLLEQKILSIAKIYKNSDKIYFPLFLDWRGRVYCDPVYLNYQSIELAKALLLFSDGSIITNELPNKSIGLTKEEYISNYKAKNANRKYKKMRGGKRYGPDYDELWVKYKENREIIDNKNKEFLKNYYDSINWLKIYGANCYGLDKQSYKKRIEWVNNNEENILNMKDEFIASSKNPLLFIAFCFEYKNYKNNPNNFITHLPIQLDATCNGIQHLSLLTQNITLAKSVNLLSGSDDEAPNDIYTDCIKYIEDKINQKSNEQKDYEILKHLKINRKLIKKSIMTISYNISVDGILDQLLEHFNKITLNKKNYYIAKDESISKKMITRGDLFRLSRIIYDILFEVHPELKELINYFKQIVEVFNELKLPIIWKTPSGMEVKQKYNVFESTRIRNNLYRGSDYTIKIPTGDINKKGQLLGFMPNLIHSLDASVLHELCYTLINRNISIYTIHDCFATTASNINILNTSIRKILISIYFNQDYIDTLHNSFKEDIKKVYKIEENKIFTNNGIKILPFKPKITKIKDLNSEILKSKYLIC